MKQSAVIELCMRQGSAQLLAQELGVSRPSLYNWKNQLLGHDVSATDRQWLTPFVDGSYQFLDNGARLLDARVMFFYAATGITPAMSESRPGTGSAYAFAARDANAAYLDGSRTYKVTLAGPVPAKDFWSFMVYDNQTRSARDRSEVGRHRQHASGDQEECGRRSDDLVRTQGASRRRKELGANDARQGLQRPAEALRTA